MTDSVSPEQALEMQKQNCIFCKIVAGAMESKQVYEDDLMLAILDINPANKGHVLVMPKEHYPILPLIPPETFSHLFATTQQLMGAMRTALIVPRVTLFIANGGSAGQRSPHFLYHLIPREDNDGLDMLDLETRGVAQEQAIAAFSQNIRTLLQKAAPDSQQPVPQPVAAQSPAPQLAPAPTPLSRPTPVAGSSPQQMAPEHTAAPQTSRDHLAMVLQQNPGLKDLIMRVPDQVETYVKSSPELSVLFEGVDIHALSARLVKNQGSFGTDETPAPQPMPVAQTPTQPPPDHLKSSPAHAKPTQPFPTHLKPAQAPRQLSPEVTATPLAVSSVATDVPDAVKMNDQDFLAFLGEKPQLKELLLTDPEKLEKMKGTNPRIAAFFRTMSPAAVAARARSLGLEADGVDFDALAKHLSK